MSTSEISSSSSANSVRARASAATVRSLASVAVPPRGREASSHSRRRPTCAGVNSPDVGVCSNEPGADRSSSMPRSISVWSVRRT